MLRAKLVSKRCQAVLVLGIKRFAHVVLRVVSLSRPYHDLIEP